MHTAHELDYQRRQPRTFLGHPLGLYLLFTVEMWERFSYYGMRALLVLYLVTKTSGGNPGRGWSEPAATALYGWYTGLAYLMPIIGGWIADKFIGTHRSMLVGGLIIAMGHVVLAISGLGAMEHSHLGMSVFVFGLALIVLGTGHFKPTVSVMVGQLYAPDDPRRDGAFTIFYMGINLGAFICAFVCGTLGEMAGWHWGFGAAAVGMILGLITYTIGRPALLRGIGLPPEGKSNSAPLFMIGSLVIAAAFGALYHVNFFSSLSDGFSAFFKLPLASTLVPAGVVAAVLIWVFWFVLKQEPDDRGPTACILIFILFNAFFWLAFEQAGSSLNLFAANMTQRQFGSWVMPATWFQSINPLVIILFAPLFASMWSALGRRGLNPSQPMKIALGLFFLGFGYVFMVLGSLGTTETNKASVIWLVATYTLHTVGELCLSPTGLSFLTRAAPRRYVSFLMGIWFLSNFVANLGGGLVAGQIPRIEKGEILLPWYHWFRLGGEADFFLMFVVSSIGAGLVMLLLVPVLKRMLHGRG